LLSWIMYGLVGVPREIINYRVKSCLDGVNYQNNLSGRYFRFLSEQFFKIWLMRIIVRSIYESAPSIASPDQQLFIEVND